MCELIINGGNRLNGEICVQGSKNAVLPILAASLLTDGEYEILNCPYISDVLTAIDILKGLGCDAIYRENIARIRSAGVTGSLVPCDLMQKMRSSVMFMGAILARRGEAILYRPGGCRLGERPIDMHIKSLSQLGARIYECGDSICCNLDKACSRDITLVYPSVGTTENIMLMCAGRNCEVRIFNPAREPEIAELQACLNAMGANIEGAGSDEIRIGRTNGLHGCRYRVAGDRIAASTYAYMTAVCGGRICLKGIDYGSIRLPLKVLADAGCSVFENNDGIWISSDGQLESVGRVKTLPYPAFPTDVQPILSTILSVAKGTSYINETIFENRFGFVPELIKMGADISQYGNSLEIRGVKELNAATVSAMDLRGGAALVTAGLAAKGTTVVQNVHYIDRGYEKIEKVIASLGGDIVRLNVK